MAVTQDQTARPCLIPATYHEKVWGRMRDGIQLGEIWCRAHPLLLKFIFTSEKLSVQVHPGDEYAREHDDSAGKTECWYIMAAEPGASLAVGLRRPMDRNEILASIRDKTIENELNWIEVHPGDFIFVPWGTVHAIGPGLTLCEVQEFSDMTYRMYDYGRPRELHLDKALDVIRSHRAAGRMPPAHGSSEDHQYLVACRYFVMERFSSAAPVSRAVAPGRFEVLVVLEGEGELLAGDSREAYRPEQMWRLPEDLGEYTVAPSRPTTWLKAYAPESLDAVEAEMARAGVSDEDRRRLVIRDL